MTVISSNLEKIQYFAELRRDLASKDRSYDQNLVDAISEARRANYNWQLIGEALGMTRQGAMRRYAKKVDYRDLRRTDDEQ